MRILVTGGCGFIGTNFVKMLVRAGHHPLVIDKLTYAATGHDEVVEIATVLHGDICDPILVGDALIQHKIDTVVHMAAESHVDNSITGSADFIQTNIHGTWNLLELVREVNPKIRFLHVSTDEVFGALGRTGVFTEDSPYRPNSPYSASKAASDHLVRAWHKTYGLDTVITNCSNNYGPHQHPEKLIPKVITNALADKAIPIYGAGEQVRDWIHVDDHCRGILHALDCARSGSTYCFGGQHEVSNLELVNTILYVLTEITGDDYQHLIEMVDDRPGHDFRYAVDPTKALVDLNWEPNTYFKQGITDLCNWFLEKNSPQPL